MGKFDTHGGYFAPKDYFRINAGGSHDENPYGGVQVGVDSQGIPNLLEEGEPVYNDFVYSDNIKADGKILKEFLLPDKYAGKLYSEIADALIEEAEERPMDPVSTNGMRAMLSRLADAQEEQKLRRDESELKKELAKLSPVELARLQAAIAPQPDVQPIQNIQPQVTPAQQMMPMETQMPLMADGGLLHDANYYRDGSGIDWSRWAARGAGFLGGAGYGVLKWAPVGAAAGGGPGAVLGTIGGSILSGIDGVMLADDLYDRDYAGAGLDVASLLVTGGLGSMFRAARGAKPGAKALSAFEKNITRSMAKEAAKKAKQEAAASARSALVTQEEAIAKNMDKLKKAGDKIAGFLEKGKDITRAEKTELKAARKEYVAATNESAALMKDWRRTRGAARRANISLFGQKTGEVIGKGAGKIGDFLWNGPAKLTDPYSLAVSGKPVRAVLSGLSDLGVKGAMVGHGVTKLLDADEAAIDAASADSTTSAIDNELMTLMSGRPSGYACGGRMPNRFDLGGLGDRMPANTLAVPAGSITDAERGYNQTRGMMHLLYPTVGNNRFMHDTEKAISDLGNAARINVSPVYTTDDAIADMDRMTDAEIEAGMDEIAADDRRWLDEINGQNAYSTAGRMIGLPVELAKLFSNISQKKNRYTYNPVTASVPTVDAPVRLLDYTDIDMSLPMNAVRQQGNATAGALMNAGAGPATYGLLLANGYNTENAMGNAALQAVTARDQLRNAVIQANNQALARRAGLLAEMGMSGAALKNRSDMFNRQQALNIQGLNYAEDQAKADAINSSLDSLVNIISGRATELARLNRINALGPFKERSDGTVVYESKCGGRLRKYGK